MQTETFALIVGGGPVGLRVSTGVIFVTLSCRSLICLGSGGFG